jgi:hypothetical protein
MMYRLKASEAEKRSHIELEVKHTLSTVSVMTLPSIYNEEVSVFLFGSELQYRSKRVEVKQEETKIVKEEITTKQGISFPFSITLESLTFYPKANGILVEIKKPTF